MADARGKAVFIDGSRYQGTWDDLGMAGVGSFLMPHGVLYEGEFKDGMHHGNGTLVYPGGQIIDGVWNRGELKKWRYTFSDGLVFDPENSTYCKFPDRRFNRSKVEGLKPAGSSLKTEEQPTKIIPLGCYDTGDGIFDPFTLCVTSFEHPPKVLRNPSADEVRWIMQHCRRGTAEPTGFQPWLNENWSTEPPELPYRLPMSNDSPQSWWKRLTTFEKDTSVLLEKLRKSAEEGHDATEISSSSRSGEDNQEFIGNHGECICVSESEPEVIEDICGLPLDVCGGDQDSKDQLPDGYKQREVICEEIASSDEWEAGEDRTDLLMTVCCPPEGTYTIRKRKTSTQNSLMNGSSKGSIVYGRDDGSIGGEDVGEYQWDDYGDPRYDHWGRGEDVGEDEWQISHGLVVGHGDKSKNLQGGKTQKPITKTRKSRKDKKKSKKKQTATGKKRKQSSLCPDFSKSYAEHLLQQKVGNLLFSPALEPPRSPVYLVKKPCDQKTCKKLEQLRKRKSIKYEVSSSQQKSPSNPQRKKRRRKICNEKITKKSEKSKICSPSIPFITVLHDRGNLIERSKREVN